MIPSLRELAWEVLKAQNVLIIPTDNEFHDLVERDRKYSAHRFAREISRPMQYHHPVSGRSWVVSVSDLYNTRWYISCRRVNRIASARIAIYDNCLTDGLDTKQEVYKYLKKESEFWGMNCEADPTMKLEEQFSQYFMRRDDGYLLDPIRDLIKDENIRRIKFLSDFNREYDFQSCIRRQLYKIVGPERYDSAVAVSCENSVHEPTTRDNYNSRRVHAPEYDRDPSCES